MSKVIRSKEEILRKLGIESLNEMQEDALLAIQNSDQVILLSPTGTGKTLAFLLPVVKGINPELMEVQVLILVPSRELAIQIETVTREMGTGLKVNAVYGGRAGVKDRADLRSPPQILIGTPGRVADHIRRGTVAFTHIHTIILDEFDKSLETGFEKEMKEILKQLPGLKNRILTSATQKIEIPDFVKIDNALKLDYLSSLKDNRLDVRLILSDKDDKFATLQRLLQHIGNKRGIIFCSFKNMIEQVSNFLNEKRIDHICFFGGMEQKDRERALIKFRNGTNRVLLATDLAARGIDVPALDFIIHFQLPYSEEEFIHRNGRTARMEQEGRAFVIQRNDKDIPTYLEETQTEEPTQKHEIKRSPWVTLFISGGRKDKISKGDIAGLFFKQGGLQKEELGMIELKQDCAFVAVHKMKAKTLVRELNNSRLKKKKVRIFKLD